MGSFRSIPANHTYKLFHIVGSHRPDGRAVPSKSRRPKHVRGQGAVIQFMFDQRQALSHRGLFEIPSIQRNDKVRGSVKKMLQLHRLASLFPGVGTGRLTELGLPNDPLAAFHIVYACPENADVCPLKVLVIAVEERVGGFENG